MTTAKKIVVSIVTVLVLALAGFVYFKFCFVYSEGVNEGDINYFQKEGFVFKTYEGKMIQTGFKTKNATTNLTNSAIQSNEFKFSVVDEHVADQLNQGSSQNVKLHWKRYLGTLPWRGKSQFIVDSVYTR
ncbi:MAG: hypothetical protein MJZ75_05470 [Paludibacteraceae bacterium]|nr:hypothetical protein [Paludibacteraceae bacterium]